MSPEPEIARLLDIMPASGRMYTKIVSKPQQPQVIEANFPLPWHRQQHPIYINFDLWRRLSRPQRDLVLLRTVASLTGIQWFKLDVYQGVTLAGIAGTTWEVVQGDVMGVAVAMGLSALAITQLWRKNRSTQKELEADEAAIKVASRRGYTDTEAAKHLLEAIEVVAQIERRSSLSFVEIIRTQNLKTIANLSPVGVPQSVRNS